MKLLRRPPFCFSPGPIAFHTFPWAGLSSEQIAASCTDSHVERFVEFARTYLAVGQEARLLAVGSGRTALLLGLEGLARHRPGRRTVVMPSYCCGALSEAVTRAGLECRFIDTTSELVSTPEQYVDACGHDTLAVVVVHLCGKRLPDAERKWIFDRCEQRGTFSIEDNCHYFTPHAPSVRPDLEFHSFGFSKTLRATAGGLLIAHRNGQEIEAAYQRYENESPAAPKARFEYFRNKHGGPGPTATQVAEHARTRAQYDRTRMTAFDAALALEQSHSITAAIDRQRANGRHLARILHGYPDVFNAQLDENNLYTRLAVTLCDVETFSRFWSHMAAAKIELEGMYRPVHLEFAAHGGSPACPVAESVFPRVFNVPNRADLTRRELRRIAKALEQFAQRCMNERNRT